MHAHSLHQLQSPDGAVLHPQLIDVGDKVAEDRLNELLFRYIRCGDWSKAVDVCTHVGQAHRALVLANADPTNSGDSTQYLDHAALGRLVAWQSAGDDRLARRERAVYGVCAGRLSSIVTQCPSTFADRLWAYTVCALVHRRYVALAEWHAKRQTHVLHPSEFVRVDDAQEATDYSIDEMMMEVCAALAEGHVSDLTAKVC